MFSLQVNTTPTLPAFVQNRGVQGKMFRPRLDENVTLSKKKERIFVDLNSRS